MTINFAMYGILAYLSNDLFEIDFKFIDFLGLSLHPNHVHMVWIFVTTLFVHLNLNHLLANMILLYIFGTETENKPGSKSVVWKTYLGIGMITGPLSLILFLGASNFTVGSSSAVFALIGVNFSLGLKRRIEFNVIYILLMIMIFYFSLAPNANYYAHLIGLVGGIIFGLSQSD